MTAEYAYLGPAGTFAYEAISTLPLPDDAVLLPAPHVAGALDMVRVGDVVAALVPLENSVEGVVPTTVDDLTFGAPLVIVDEVVLPIRLALMARPGSSAVTAIGSHPHAIAQCRAWLAAEYPDAELIGTGSTAGAAAALADGTATFDAAVAPLGAAATYGLDVVAIDIADNREAWTRFVLVTRPGQVPLPTGADKTTLCLFMREDHPGALLEILTEFAVRGVNLTRIESRPTKRALGDYYFSIDFEGHVADARVGEALAGLHRICADVRFLGSYARHDGKSPVLRAGVTDVDYAEAAAWLSRIRTEG